MDRHVHRLIQPFPVDDDVPAVVTDHAGQIDGGQIARLVGQQRLFPAGVGALDLAQLGIGVVIVDQVQENQPRVPGLPSHFSQQVKNLFGVQPSGNLARAGVDQIVLLAFLHPFHKIGIDRYRYVEVDQGLAVFLGPDEPQDVGVVNPQDAHVGAAAGTALLHHVGGGIEGADETDRTAGDASGGADNVTLGPEPAEGEARPAPALVDQRRLLDLGEDLVKGVFNRQHETGRELLQLPAGVHQSRRVGQQLQSPHHVVKTVFGGLAFSLRCAVVEVRLGQIDRHPAEQAVGVFQDVAVPVLGEVPPPEDHLRVFGQLARALVDPVGDAGGL